MNNSGVCALCGLHDFDHSEIGRLKDWSQDDSPLLIHEGCLYWSEAAFLDESTNAEDFIVFNPDEPREIYSSSLSSYCAICSKPGASTKPYYGSLHNSLVRVHFPCAARNGFTISFGHPDCVNAYDARRFAIPRPKLVSTLSPQLRLSV